jgi:hypothetical protein
MEGAHRRAIFRERGLRNGSIGALEALFIAHFYGNEWRELMCGSNINREATSLGDSQQIAQVQPTISCCAVVADRGKGGEKKAGKRMHALNSCANLRLLENLARPPNASTLVLSLAAVCQLC